MFFLFFGEGLWINNYELTNILEDPQSTLPPCGVARDWSDQKPTWKKAMWIDTRRYRAWRVFLPPEMRDLHGELISGRKKRRLRVHLNHLLNRCLWYGRRSDRHILSTPGLYWPFSNRYIHLEKCWQPVNDLNKTLIAPSEISWSPPILGESRHGYQPQLRLITSCGHISPTHQ